MDVRNCRNCGNLFNYLSGPDICPSCRDKAEKRFQDVKEYIRNNPGATIQQISEDNEVSTNQIRQWVREERLQFADDSPVGIECEKCGKQIRTGRFCQSCKDNMASALTEGFKRPAAPEPPAKPSKSGDRMYHL